MDEMFNIKCTTVLVVLHETYYIFENEAEQFIYFWFLS